MTQRPLFGIGHNNGPGAGRGFRRHCWKLARRQTIGRAMPLEIVRIRVRRARQLGLAYPQYAAILMGSGRDVAAFLFTTEALGLRLRRRLEMPSDVQERLAALQNCDRLAFAPSGEEPEPFRIELQDVSGLIFASCGRPPEGDSWSAARAAVRSVLDPMKLPGDAVVMIGTRAEEAGWAEAAKMARFLPAERYFAAT